MALRNAFENLAVESTQQSILTELQNLVVNQGSAGLQKWLVDTGVADPASDTELQNVVSKLQAVLTQLQSGIPVNQQNPNAGMLDAWPVALDLEDSVMADAFGRLRVSNPKTQLEFNHVWDLAPLFAGKTSDTTGTVAHVAPAARLTCTSGQICKYRSHAYSVYQPGKGRLARLTAYFPQANGWNQWMGYADDDDGVLFMRDTSGVWNIVLRSSTIGDITVSQSQWNVDKMDGTGPSGFTLPAYGNIHFSVDFEWLSMGKVRWNLECNGKARTIHQMDFANQVGYAGAYMRSGSLPITWELDGGGGTGTLDAVCAAVISEGGQDPSGLLWGARNQSSISMGLLGTVTPLLAIRPRSTFNGFTNHGLMRPGSVTCWSEADVMCEIWIAGTHTGTWNKVDTTTSPAADGNSHAEYMDNITNFTGGRLLGSFAVAAGGAISSGVNSGQIFADLILSQGSDGYQLPITIVARALSSGLNKSAAASVQWVETR